MKCYSLLLTISVLLALAASTASFAAFPEPDGSVVFGLGMGWFNDTPAWFVSTDTTDISLAGTQRLTLFEAVPTGAAPVYVVTNPAEPQGPIFSTAPGPAPVLYPPPYYSGIWRVVYVDWNSGATRMPLTSAQQIMAMASAGALSLLGTQTAVDYSIVAIGSLGDPVYVTPQVRGIDPVRLQVELPAWNVYSQDWDTGRETVKRVIIPDAFSQPSNAAGYIDLAPIIGANEAYGLGSIGPVDIDNAIVAIDWTQFAADGGVLPVRPDQFLVERDTPTAGGPANGNSSYSPFATLTVLARFPTTPWDALFTDWNQVWNSPALAGVYSDTVNAPVLPY